jgi:nucleoside-diphosphate-sugar epimerase
MVNHSDHRAIGEATLDACFPLARDLLSFPHHLQAGLKPHKVKDLLLYSIVPENATFYVDVTETFADVTDLMRDTGFRPQTSIEDGLRDFVAWYRDYYRV